MKCGKCQEEFSSHGDCVTCVVCALQYHFNCSIRETKWRNMSVEQKGKWACSKCKGADNTLPRTNSEGSNLSGVSNVDNSEEELSTKAVLMQINSRLSKLDEVKSTVDEMAKALDFLSGRYDELLKEVQAYKEENKNLRAELGHHKDECKKKSEELKTLTSRFNSLEQYGRGVNLEMHGVEEVDYETTETVLEKTARALGLSYHPSQIQAAHRLPSQDKKRTPVLLVQFVSKAVKQMWLVEGRRKKLKSRDIVGVGDGRVYFNENLTPFYSRLYAETRKVAKDKGYEQVWILNGTIRAKKNHTSRQTIIITSYDDLNRLT